MGRSYHGNRLEDDLGQLLPGCLLFHQQFLSAISPRKVAETSYRFPCKDEDSHRWPTCKRHEGDQQLETRHVRKIDFMNDAIDSPRPIDL
jgi:hypothetical protein